MIQFLFFTSLALSLFSLGTQALNKRACLSFLTQYRIEREITYQVKKSHSFKIARLQLKHLQKCKVPIQNPYRTQSKNFLGQKIKFLIGGKIEDSK